MKPNTQLRFCIAAFVFFLAAIAGWKGVKLPDKTKATALPVLPAKLPAAPIDVPAVSPTLSQLGNGALIDLEKALLLNLDPGAVIHTGERLMELCLEESAEDLPMPHSAFTYAAAWARQNPQGMCEWFQLRGGFTLPAGGVFGNMSYGFGNQIFREYTKKDPDAAIKAALSWSKQADRSAALVEVIQQLRITDPARAATLASEQIALLAPDDGGDLSAYGKDYRENWDFLTALPAGKDRAKILARYFRNAVQYHSQESGQFWKEMPDALRREIVAGGWLQGKLADPDSPNYLPGINQLYRDHVETTGDLRSAGEWLQSGAREWAMQDPAAAVAWAQQHLKGEQRVDGTAAMFSAGAAHDFASTLRVWQALPEGILKARAAGNLAAGAPESRKAEAEALLESLPPADRSIANAAKKTAQDAERQRQYRLEELRNPAQG